MRYHSMKYTERENELINLVDSLNVSNLKKAGHNANYWEVRKLVETLSDEVNRWIFDVNAFEMKQYKTVSQDIKGHTLKEMDSKLRLIKLWLQREIRLCLEAKYNE